MRQCPKCKKEINNSGRCFNVECSVYSYRVLEEEPEQEECYECAGAGWDMKCFGNAPVEVKCEFCDGSGFIEVI